MKLSIEKIVVCTLLIFAGSLLAASQAAEVQVRLTDGRTLHGSLVESQLNADQLGLEVRSAGITIRRTLAWKQIASVKVKSLRKPDKPNEPVRWHANRNTAEQGHEQPFDNVVNPTGEADSALPLSELIVSAQPVSTFGKMDWDSLRLSLQGFDQLGQPVPLFGTLQVTLWGLREEVGRPLRVSTPAGYVDVISQQRLELDRIQTWTRSLDSMTQRLPGTGVPIGGRPGRGGIVYEDATAHPWSASGFGNQTVVGFQGRQDRGRPIYVRNPTDIVQMLLPLPQPLPDSDATRWPLGEVTVELLMPGVGVFSASSPGIALVHQSPLRQVLLNQGGSRFFPNEGTTDGRGFWRNPGQPLQQQLITPPFPTPIVTNPIPVIVPNPLPVTVPNPLPVTVIPHAH